MIRRPETIHKAYDNANFPVEYLWESVNDGRSKLFETAVVLSNIHDRSGMDDVKPSLLFVFEEAEGSVMGRLEYNTSCYEPATIQRLIGHMLQVFTVIMGNIETPLSDIELLSPEERNQILTVFNQTEASYRKEMTLHGMFEEQVERTPDHLAVVFGQEYLS